MNIMRKKFQKALLSSVAALAAAGAIVTAPSVAWAQANQCAEEAGGPSKTLTPRVAQGLQTIFEQMQAEQYQAARAALDQLIAQRGGSFSPFDRATVYEMRGSVKAGLEDFRGAQRDFQEALNAGALPPARNNQLRYFIAQLNFQLEDYQGAISGLNNWIRTARQCGQEVDPNAYYLLAAAYTQVTPPNWRAALDPAERAKAGQPEPRKSYYDLLNLIYSELNNNAKRGPLLEEMVNYWPGNKSYWTQLSGAYSQGGRDRDAFSVLEVAYRAGLLTTESEMLTLVQYYSYFENPFRGAKLLEREMNAGNIKRTQKNLVLLSQLWSQAREHKKAIPVLRAAAQQSSDGDLYYRLGQVLLADEQYRAAQTALQNALNAGGMNSRNTGDAWLLLGTARFSQAGPEDTKIWASARKAFVNAQRYDNARRRASEWIQYIDAVASTYEAQKALEVQQKRERCEADLSRIETQQRIRELQNRQPTPAELELEARVAAECGEDEAEAAAEEADETAESDDDFTPAADTLNAGAETAEDAATENEDTGAEN